MQATNAGGAGLRPHPGLQVTTRDHRLSQGRLQLISHSLGRWGTSLPIETRFFSFDDLKPEADWLLLEWCTRHGADEFTVSALTAGQESERMKRFFEQLEPFALPAAPRRLLSAPAAHELTRCVERWRLDENALDLLRAALPMGFASREYDEALWLEDLAVYRDGEFMMGVLSHENGGVLRITALELAELRATGFPDRDEVPWVGF